MDRKNLKINTIIFVAILILYIGIRHEMIFLVANSESLPENDFLNFEIESLLGNKLKDTSLNLDKNDALFIMSAQGCSPCQNDLIRAFRKEILNGGIKLYFCNVDTLEATQILRVNRINMPPIIIEGKLSQLIKYPVFISLSEEKINNVLFPVPLSLENDIVRIDSIINRL